MKRSTYSLILMDDVVAAVDALAAQRGTSRSNYINQILADHVRCVTPEQQMRQVFDYVAQRMDAAFRIQEQNSDAMLSIFGSVQFKYRPSIRYSVELARDFHGETAGYLKISCRTQSRTLLDAMQTFFLFWIRMEQNYDKNGACAQGLFEIEPGRMTRVLLRGDIADEAALGKAVGDYIQMFHGVLQTYFNGLQQKLPAAVLQHTLEQQFLASAEKMERYL